MVLNAKIRVLKGKSSNRNLRRLNKIPAVLYGPRGNFILEMEEESTRQKLEKLKNTHELVNLQINNLENEKTWAGKVLLKDIQKHSFRNKIIHIDFLEPTKDKLIKIKIKIKVIGECPGVKAGGVLQVVVRDILVLCPSNQIPPFIEVDVSKLNLGQTLKITDLNIPKFLKLQTKENFPIISVLGRSKNVNDESENSDESSENTNNQTKDKEDSK